MNTILLTIGLIGQLFPLTLITVAFINNHIDRMV